ncbi:hypothetical protein GE09DRAFT_1224799 [Coniochaeta sp. 2T2.1]|nr:hypothetical protein GE09DRAFT_1224799 [Coniochaeta sp. 2T2.1]
MACEPSSVDSNPQRASYLVADVTPEHSQIEAYVREQLRRHAQANPSCYATEEEARLMAQTISWSTRRFDIARLKTALALLMGLDALTSQKALRPPHRDTGLRDLYKTYASGLHGQERQLALNVLHLLQVLEPDELSMQQMCQYLSLSQASGVESWGEVALISEAHILRICGPLVRRTVEGPTVELSHRVVRELFPADEPNVRLRIGLACLRLLNLQDFAHPPEEFHIEMAKTGNRKPHLYSYAAETWMGVELGSSHDKIPREEFCSEARVLFKSVRSGNFISWLAEMGRRRLEGLYSLPSPQTFLCINAVCTKSNLSPLHYAACFGLTDVCHSLIIRKHSVNETSELRTPLYCALAGPALLLSNILDFDWAVARKDYRLRERFATAGKLLDMGALAGKHNNMLPRRCKSPSFAAVALMACAARSGPRDCHLFAMFCPDEQYPTDPDFFALFQDTRFPYDPMEPDSGDGPSTPQYRAFLDDMCAMLMDVSWKHGRREIRNATRDKAVTYGLKKCFSPQGGVPLTDDGFNNVVLEAVYTAFGVEEKWMRADLDYLMKDARFSTELSLKDQPAEDRGRTLLHEAVEHDSIYWVDRFLKSGADVAVADASGRTPLHLCESSNVLRLLARHGANLRQTDNDGRLLWHYAAANNDIKLLRTLHELDPDKKWVFRQVTKQNRTPLAEAFAYIRELNGLSPVPRSQYPGFLEEKTQSIRFILALLVDHSTDYLRSDVPVICRAAEWGQVDIVRALSSFQGLQMIKNGRNALHYLNFYASASLIREIMNISSSLDEHPLDNQGRSPAETIFLNFKPRTFDEPRDNAHPSNNADLDRAAYMELLTDSVCKTRDNSDRTLWERFCDIMARYVRGKPWPRVGEGLITAVNCMVEKGVIHEYESYTGLCAFTELARRFWDIWRVMGIEKVPHWLPHVYSRLIQATTKIPPTDDSEFGVFFPAAHPGYRQICDLIEVRRYWLTRHLLPAAAEEPGRGDQGMANNA